MTFTVALLQIAALGKDQQANLLKGLRFCREAQAAGADLAVFPELWNLGCEPFPLDKSGQQLWNASAITQDSDFFQQFVALARELHLNIAVTYLQAHHPKPRNSVSIINNSGDVVLNYSKVFICNFGEDELLKAEPNSADIGCDIGCDPGDSFDVCTLSTSEGEVRVGAMICADREFPEAASQLMLNGAELIIVPNACTWDEVRTAGLKTRAFENLIGVAMANYPGLNGGSSGAYTGVAWKNGRIQDMRIAEANQDEQLLLCHFDIDEIRTFRKEESWRISYRQRYRKLNAV